MSTAGSIVVQAISNLLSYCGEALINWIVGEAAQRRAEATANDVGSLLFTAARRSITGP